MPKMDVPKPCVKVSHRKPPTPPPEQSESWSAAARYHERPAIANLVMKLQERLEREQKATEKAQDKLDRKLGLPNRRSPLSRSGTLSLSALPLQERAQAISAARKYGLYPEGAAGVRPHAAGGIMGGQPADPNARQRRPEERPHATVRTPLVCGAM